MNRIADMSDCGRYRYRLERRWGPGEPLVFVMLNPSTADGMQDDPTIRKCIGFADRRSMYAIVVVNLFAYRCTDPMGLKCLPASTDPEGPENDSYIRTALSETDHVIAAWGRHGTYRERDMRFLQTVGNQDVDLLALRINNDGTPAHPLMLPYSCEPVHYDFMTRYNARKL